MQIWHSFKHRERRKQILIGGAIALPILLISAAVIHGKTTNRSSQITADTAPITYATECPEKVEIDPTTNMPVWVKGETRLQISGEVDGWIAENCVTATPSSSDTTIATATSSATTSPRASLSEKTSPTPSQTPPSTKATTSNTATPTPTATTTATPTPSPSPSPSPTLDPTLVPTLQNLGLSFSGTNETGGPGEFSFTGVSKPLFEYGAQVNGPDGPKYLYEFTYYVLSNTNVLAAIDGVVQRVRYQSDTGDYEIDLLPHANSYWNVNYDHVTNLTVSEGQTVTAGTVLGKAKANGTVAWFELALLYGGSNNITGYRYCPLYAAAASFDTQIANLMSSWESHIGDTSLYNESTFAYAPGCTTERALNQ